MKHALISDVHSNLPALEAVLADIDAREDVAATYHLGDLVGYAPWPNEVVALIRERGIPGIAGNYDSTVANDYKHCGCKAESPRAEELSHISYAWTREHVEPETKAFLRGLPFRMDLRVRGGHTSRPQITLVHGTPTLNTLYWTEDRPDSFCTRMAKTAGLREGDLIAFGHTHKPWHREVGGVRFVNVGSVGKPKDGDWRACYALVEAGEEVGGVEFVRVEYDLERAMDGIHRSGLPDEFADQLRAGGAPEPSEVRQGGGRR
ncbi:phosphoesterase [Rubrobacter xylanophilus]|uniref:Phosphoesterase n=1 Tax=Rubrobacter xylanophilus TaxID=49319 RepID=A0A510HND6_9ACTN|nr:metallophosphoesterase family protein [Rubrobacter xylanophilus]BBL80935.1 phosphoesterase [Rubrobacter xylanophilus]